MLISASRGTSTASESIHNPEGFRKRIPRTYAGCKEDFTVLAFVEDFFVLSSRTQNMSTENRGILPQKLTRRQKATRAISAMAATGALWVGANKINREEDTNLYNRQSAYALQIDPPLTLIAEAEKSREVKGNVIYGPVRPNEDFLYGQEMAMKAGEEYLPGTEGAKNVKKAEGQSGVQASGFGEVSVLSNVPSGKLRIDTENPTVWQILADCETGDGQVGFPYYATWDSNGNFEGAFQFLNSTWKSLNEASGYEHAYQAPPEVQLKAAQELQERGGWGQWPDCTSRMNEQGFIK